MSAGPAPGTGTGTESSGSVLSIRPARTADLPAVLELWQTATQPSHTDDIDSLGRLLERDAGALLVAEDGDDIVGSIMATFDGWRGTVHRLAVAPLPPKRARAPTAASRRGAARHAGRRAHASDRHRDRCHGHGLLAGDRLGRADRADPLHQGLTAVVDRPSQPVAVYTVVGI